MTRPTAAKQPKAVTKKECGTCGEIFTGVACTNCGEKVNIFPVNKDGIPIADVANAVGGTGAAPPIQLKRSPDFIDMDTELDLAVEREFKETLRSASLDKVKAMRAEQAAKLLRAEGELDATRQGFIPPKSDDTEPRQAQQPAMQQPSMNTAVLIQALGGWTQDARDQLFERLREDPDFALNFSRMVNPQPQMPGIPQFGMNPYAMMQQPPQAEPAPQLDPISLVTAMIAGMKSIQDLGGGNNSNSDRQMDIMIDEIKEMRKETADLREKLIEAQNKPTGITQDSVRLIISDALANNSKAHADIQEGVRVIDDLKSLTNGLVDLGIMQKVQPGNDKPSLDQQKLDHAIRMDDRRESREHELNIERERSMQAEAGTKETLLSNLFAVSQEQKEAASEDALKEKPIIDEVVIESRKPAVIA